MEDENIERRRAPRYPIRAKVIVRSQSGLTVPAASVDISSNGVLLHMDEPCPLTHGEEVTVEVELPYDPDKALSSWGLGRVVRLDGTRTAVELIAGNFDIPPEQSGEDPEPRDS